MRAINSSKILMKSSNSCLFLHTPIISSAYAVKHSPILYMILSASMIVRLKRWGDVIIPCTTPFSVLMLLCGNQIWIYFCMYFRSSISLSLRIYSFSRVSYTLSLGTLSNADLRSKKIVYTSFLGSFISSFMFCWVNLLASLIP